MKVKATLIVGAFLMTFASAGQATTLDFASENSTGSCVGRTVDLGTSNSFWCFKAGDMLQETFEETGLQSVAKAVWSLSFIDYTRKGVLNAFDLYINKTKVGDFAWVSDGDSSNIEEIDITTVFDPIIGEDFTLMMVATTDVPSGFSSWKWRKGGTVELTEAQSVTAVPLPSGLPLVLSGVGAFALLRRRRKQAS